MPFDYDPPVCFDRDFGSCSHEIFLEEVSTTCGSGWVNLSLQFA